MAKRKYGRPLAAGEKRMVQVRHRGVWTEAEFVERTPEGGVLARVAGRAATAYGQLDWRYPWGKFYPARAKIAGVWVPCLIMHRDSATGRAQVELHPTHGQGRTWLNRDEWRDAAELHVVPVAEHLLPRQLSCVELNDALAALGREAVYRPQPDGGAVWASEGGGWVAEMRVSRFGPRGALKVEFFRTK